MRKKNTDKIFIFSIYILVSIFTIVCLYPMLMAVSVSLSDEQTVALHGFKLIPEKFSLYTYKYFLMDKGTRLLTSYAVTIFVVIAGTLCSVATTTAYAFSSSVKTFKFGNALSFFAYFTMLFNGGMLPWYILCTKYYNLNNTIYGLFLPYLMNVFYMFLMRNFFRTIHPEIIESAKIDGAGYLKIFFRIMVPLGKVGIITITLFYALGYWNDWYLALLLTSNEKLYPMQYLLYTMLANAQFLASGNNASMAQHVTVPVQTARMAMTCLAVGPIIFVYPFTQKYFIKGITLGSIK